MAAAHWPLRNSTCGSIPEITVGTLPGLGTQKGADGMLNRMIGAARLSVETYEEVEHDRSATIQALLVVIIVAAFSGIGTFLSGDASILDAVILGAVRGVAGWAVWALVTWIVGVTILKAPDTEADWGQLARVTGFAQTPGLLNILIFIPWSDGQSDWRRSCGSS